MSPVFLGLSIKISLEIVSDMTILTYFLEGKARGRYFFKSFAYIMQLISFILSATADSENVAAIIPVCDDGWNKFEAHCYFYSGGKELKLSWANAEKDCINRGGHLASIHSQAEQLFVFSISTIPTWLGASDIISEVCFPSSLSSI
jgi:hypothetical protein